MQLCRQYPTFLSCFWTWNINENNVIINILRFKIKLYTVRYFQRRPTGMPRCGLRRNHHRLRPTAGFGHFPQPDCITRTNVTGPHPLPRHCCLWSAGTNVFCSRRMAEIWFRNQNGHRICRSTAKSIRIVSCNRRLPITT